MIKDRSIRAVIERLRFGDSDGDDHDIAAAELERLLGLAGETSDEHTGKPAITLKSVDEVGENTPERRAQQLRDAHAAIAAAAQGADVGGVFFLIVGNGIKSADGHTCVFAQAAPSVLPLMLSAVIGTAESLRGSASVTGIDRFRSRE